MLDCSKGWQILVLKTKFGKKCAKFFSSFFLATCYFDEDLKLKTNDKNRWINSYRWSIADLVCPTVPTPLPSSPPATSPSPSPSFLTTVLCKTYYREGNTSTFFNKANISTNLLQTWYNVLSGLLSREQYILFLMDF